MAVIDNSLLMALAMIERIEPQLKLEHRDQISKANLSFIDQSLSQAVEKISKANCDTYSILSNLISALELIKILLEDETFDYTDSNTKEILGDKIMTSLQDLYLVVGKYYTNHEFNYNVRMEPLLQRIVDKCLERGYYFGINVD